MKPYLESIRRLTRVGLILFALSVIASIIVSIQYCNSAYHDSVPSLSKMFLPLIVFIYAGGILLAMEGFSFLNRRRDSDFYHSLPVARKKLFWSITLAAFTWIAATVLGSVLFTTIVFTITKTPFVQLYSLFAVPYFTIATILVFAAAAIAMNLTGTIITGLGLTVLILGLFRFVQFSVARGIVANTQIIGWLDLPWYLTPVTNIATGQIAQLLRPMLRQTLYTPVNVIYSAVLAGIELLIARRLFERRPSELAEHGAKNAASQTVFACLSMIPVLMLLSSGVVSQRNVSIPIIIGVAVGIYVIYQIIVLRQTKKVLLSLPWLLIPLAIGVAGLFGTQGITKAMVNTIPRAADVAYVQFPGSSRGTERITYQEYLVSKVEFSDPDIIQYSVDTLADNLSSIRQYGYVNYSYDPDSGNFLTTEPVTFVMKNGQRISRVLTYLNQHALQGARESNSAYQAAIRTLPPESAVCYIQGEDPFKGGFASSQAVLNTYYKELAKLGFVANDVYRTYDPNNQYSVDEDQYFGSLMVSGYVGMTRYSDYYNIRREMPESASAWMRFENDNSKGEYLDIMQQMMKKAGSLAYAMDYFSINMSFYNVPMTDGTQQTMSFYFDRSGSEDQNEIKDQMQPLMDELSDIMLRSVPTINPYDFCVLTNWSGRVHKDDGTYYGADIIAKQMITNSDSTFVSGSSVYYVSDGSVYISGNAGTLTSYNPSYRTFAPQDQKRLVEILQQWQALQNLYYSANNGGIDGSPTIGGLQIAATPTPTP